MRCAFTGTLSKDKTPMGCLKEIADVLRFFSSIKIYSYVDRVANAVSPLPAETALIEALRHLRTLWSTAKLDEEHRIHFVEVEGTRKYLPSIPSNKCVEEVLELVRKDDEARRMLAALSLSY